MKLNIFLIALLSSSCVVAQTNKNFSNQEEFLRSTPKPFYGVQIVPTSEMDMPEAAKKEMALSLKQMKSKGYIESNSSNAQNLMSIKERIPQNPLSLTYQKDNNDYYLKKDESDIKLSFFYKKISDHSKLLGFAPIGTTINSGWTGIKEFFEDKNIGICAFSTYHLTGSKMNIKIDAARVSYIVNNYPTSMEVEGSNKKGFMYSLSWIDQEFANDLQCAKMEFDKANLEKMIQLANKIAKLRE